MDKDLKILRRKVCNLESFISDNIARIVFERLLSDYDERKKVLSILKEKSEGRSIIIKDDFTMWVDYINPDIAKQMLNSNFEWIYLRNIEGLIDSLCEMYYNFDLCIK